MSTIDRQSVIKAFCDECVWLHSIRKHFTDLFEFDKQRDQLLSEVANTFFHDLNLILIEYILLQKCKLTDPASSDKEQKKLNLTTNYILQLEWTPATKKLLQEQNAILLSFREKVVDARRKLIAHLDLKARLQPFSLGQFSESDEEAFWLALQNFVNAAHDEAIGGPFEISAPMQEGDVSSLIHHLKDGVDYSDLANQNDQFLFGRIGKRRYEDA